MPRTKVIKKRKSTAAEVEEDIMKQALPRIKKKEEDFDMLLQSLTMELDSVLASIPDEIRKITLNDLMNIEENEMSQNESTESEDHVAINVVPPSTIKARKMLKRQTAASTDDGYVTESGAQQGPGKRVSRADKKTSQSIKSVSRTLRSSSTSKIQHKTRQRSSSRGASASRIKNQFVTPAASRNQTEYSLVTPKVKPNTPLNVLRRPRAGEMALSLQGSPLLVTSIDPGNTATINVPLNNGNVVSLLPNEGLRLSHIPTIDEATMKQLETLRGHIEKVIGKR